MQFKGNGYITVFFSLVLSIMLSLILTLFEGARRSEEHTSDSSH